MNEPFDPLAENSSDPAAGQGHQGLPKATIMVSFATILIAALATFLAMQWTGSRAASDQLQQQLDEITQQETVIDQELGELQSQWSDLQERTDVLGTGSFVFCNNGDTTVTIKHLSSTFLNPAGEFETFSTEAYGEDLWEVASSSKIDLDFGNGAIWDGSVTYYSVVLEVDGAQYPFSGFWQPEQTDCVLSWPSA